MIFLDDSLIKIGGIILPGIVKSLEVKSDALVEEQEVEGSSAKPKQAIGYEDAKVIIELILEDGETITKEDKLRTIQNLFRKSNQEKPEIHELINEHTAVRGITKVIFKSMTTKETNKKEELTVSIELWEYIAATITAIKKSSSNSSGAGGNATNGSGINLDEDYKNYLSGNRGNAPKVNDKTTSTPAIDDFIASSFKPVSERQ